eukprot:1156896-Pelagomonas_calceolata.AAC.13
MAKALLVWGPSWAPADSLAGMARQHLAQPLWQVLARPTEALGVVKLCPPSTLHQTLKGRLPPPFVLLCPKALLADTIKCALGQDLGRQKASAVLTPSAVSLFKA